MSRVEVEPRGTKVMLRKLKALQSEVENPEAGLEAIGDVLQRSTVQRFWTSEPPTGGRKWKPSKLAKRKRRRTLVRTGDLRDSIRYHVSGSTLRVGTDIWYGFLHQRGGELDAEYRRKSGATRGPSLRLPKLAPPDAASAARTVAAAARRRAVQRRQSKRARKVRLPARRFLGVSKRDRQRSLEVMLKAMEEALR